MSTSGSNSPDPSNARGFHRLLPEVPFPPPIDNPCSKGRSISRLAKLLDEQQLATLKLALSKQEPTLIRRDRQSGLRVNRLWELANRLDRAGCEIEVFHDCRCAQIYEICPVHSEPELHFTFRG